MIRIARIGFYLCFAMSVVGCRDSLKKEESILLFSAASTTNIVSEICDSFQLKKNVKVNLNFASSGSLARQIEQGSTANVFISANKVWADYVEKLGEVSNRKKLYKNRLVLITNLGNELDNVSMSKDTKLSTIITNRLAMGDPMHVPAGIYAKEAMKSLGWYSDIEKKILPTKDVRSALMMVELQECDLGIVYYSDAIKSEKVKIVGIFPEESHQNINFHALLFNNSPKEAEELFHFLSDTSVIQVWMRNGLQKL